MTQHWNEKLEKLDSPMKNKIRTLIENGCIRKVNDDEYKCLPILGYNKTTYTMVRKPDGNFKCNCQGYHEHNNCTHLEALRIAWEVNSNQGVLF